MTEEEWKYYKEARDKDSQDLGVNVFDLLKNKKK